MRAVPASGALSPDASGQGGHGIITVALVVYAILGLLADALVRQLQRKALVWRRDFIQ